MNLVTGLSLGRIAVGVASLARPSAVSSAVAPGSPHGPQLITQAFGSRELALGAATLLSRGASRRTLVLIGMAVDAADAATTYTAIEQEEIPRKQGQAMVVVAVVAVLSGLLGLRVKKQLVVEAV